MLAIVVVWFGEESDLPVVKLTRQSGLLGSVQLAFEEQPAAQLTGKLSQQAVLPLARLRQDSPFGQAVGQLAHTPALVQLGVAPPHVPHSSVPPHPSGAVPQRRPSSAHVLGMQTHWPLRHCDCGPQQIPLQHGPSQHWPSWQQTLLAGRQPLMQPPPWAAQAVAGGPQHWPSQPNVAGSPQQLSPAQPLASSSQVEPPQVPTRSAHRLSKQLPEQQSLAWQQTPPFARPQRPPQHCWPLGQLVAVHWHCPLP